MTDDEIEHLLSTMERTPELAPALAKVRGQGFNAYPTIPIDAALARPGVADALLSALSEHLPPRQAGI